MAQALRRTGVASVMDRSLVRVGRELPARQARELLREQPRYLLIGGESPGPVLMPSAHLAAYLEAHESDNPDEAIDLLAIPAERLQVATIGLQANLEEASETLRRNGVEALLVKRRTAAGGQRVFGALTPEMIEQAYRY